MFTSTAGVFRTRQAMFDLTSYVSHQGRNAFRRITVSADPDARLDSLLVKRGGRLILPSDYRILGEIQLAAALPDEDFPAFTCATALLLLDRLAGGNGDDDLFWNWDAFADHYRLADPAIRATLMNGFRTAAEVGRVSLSERPDPVDCLTRRPEEVLCALQKAGEKRMAEAIESDVTPEAAAKVWLELATMDPAEVLLNGVRYLYERPQSISPRDPETAPLIPWAV